MKQTDILHSAQFPQTHIELVWGFGAGELSDTDKAQAAALIRNHYENDSTLAETVRVRVYRRSRAGIGDSKDDEVLSERFIVVFLSATSEELSPAKNKMMLMLTMTHGLWSSLLLKQVSPKSR